MLNLKKITTTVSLLSLGALSVALFSTGCDSGTSNNGTGGAGGHSTGGAGGHGGAGTAGAAGGHGGTATGGAAGGHGGSATGGAAGGHGGSATGGVAGAAGGHGGSATGGVGGSEVGGQAGTAAGGHGGSATGGVGGAEVGGAAGTAAGGSAGGAGGQANIMYNVALTGAMEVLTAGQTASTATGSATVILNPNTGAVSVQGSFTGLSSSAISAHIHGPAPAGMNANPIVVLSATSATAGAVSGNGTLTAQQVTDMKAGLTYINVHSTNYHDGEIRGQIQ